MNLKIPWYLRIIFTSISILSFYFVIASGNIFALAGLGLTGLLGLLDLVAKGVELVIENTGFLFLKSETKKSIIIRQSAA
jgi:hypothetical protein